MQDRLYGRLLDHGTGDIEQARYLLLLGTSPWLSSDMRNRLAPPEPIFHMGNLCFVGTTGRNTRNTNLHSPVVTMRVCRLHCYRRIEKESLHGLQMHRL